MDKIIFSPWDKSLSCMHFHSKNAFFFLLLTLVVLSCSAPEKKADDGSGFERKFITANPDPTPLSPEETIKKFQLPPGYHAEVVANEPMVQEPVAMAWDGNGRLYVVQMNTYMKDANGSEEYEPASRVMRLEDTDGDGKIDKSTIFIDSLVLPRTVLPVGDEVYITVTNTQHVWSYKDTNNDGVADQKKIVFENKTIDARNLEHQNGAFLWNLDNWIYPSRDDLRYKYKNGELVVDTLVDHMFGQWGLTSDNYGRLYFSEAGPGLPAVQIQQMPAYGSLNLRDQYSEDFTYLWPVIGNIDANTGPDGRRDDNTLIHFTSGAGQVIYRGDRLPADMVGDYFIPEPVARVIKRGKVRNENGKLVIEPAYHEKEWLASADMNFRPVNTYTGPDGCFYIVDMYHGIIQESEWTQPGSYVAGKIKELGLDKNKGMGRIYRIVHDDFKPDMTKPNMLNETPAELVKHLGHPNGWWRDMAQQTIIVRNDKSVVPELKKLATEDKNPLVRIHAIWTLEGLESLDKKTIFAALDDADANVRKTAVWASEAFITQNDEEIISAISGLKNDPSADVKIQITLSLRTNKTSSAQKLVKELLAENPDNELMQFSYKIFEESRIKTEAELARIKNLSPAERDLVSKGAVNYKQLCSTCHGPDGKGILIGSNPMPAPPLVGSARVAGDKIALIQLMLLGLQGPVDGKDYPNVMPAVAGNSDEYIASVLSYIRNSSDLGNKSSVVTVEEVKEVRGFTQYKVEGGTTLRSLEIGKLGRAENTNWDRDRNKKKMMKNRLLIVLLLTGLVSYGQERTLTNKLGIEFILVQPGTMTVGKFQPTVDRPEDPKDRLPDSLYVEAEKLAKAAYLPGFEVKLNKTYYIGKFEITQAQWRIVMGSNPSVFTASKVSDDIDKHPVENVSWKDVQEFIKKLNALDKEHTYRLPTEFEWEYAARAGHKDDIAWKEIFETAVLSGQTTTIVGSKKPNAWGLYDMLGNVWEWVQDGYNEKIFADPKSPKKAKEHVLKGSSFTGDVKNATYMNHSAGPGNGFDVGFRIVMDVKSGDNLKTSTASRPSAAISILADKEDDVRKGPAIAQAQLPEGFKSIFNGKDLKGWHVSRTTHQGTTPNFHVENGVLVVTQQPYGQGGVLLTDKKYKNFELYIEIKIEPHTNGGIFIRSTESGVAYQIELDESAGSTGSLYGERMRVSESMKAEKLAEVFKPGEWNSFRLRMTGDIPHLTLWINGLEMWDVTQPKNDFINEATEGMIGLQSHWTALYSSSAGKWDHLESWIPGAKHQYRNIGIKELP